MLCLCMVYWFHLLHSSVERNHHKTTLIQMLATTTRNKFTSMLYAVNRKKKQIPQEFFRYLWVLLGILSENKTSVLGFYIETLRVLPLRTKTINTHKPTRLSFSWQSYKYFSSLFSPPRANTSFCITKKRQPVCKLITLLTELIT